MGGYTYYWSGRSDGYHAQGVAVANSNDNRGNTGQRAYYETKDSSRISLVSVFATTEASDLTVKDAFYAILKSVVDQCPRRDTLLVLGDFNASTGTDRDGYETCWSPWVWNCKPE